GELRAAMDAVAKRGDVAPDRFGLWGISLGGYVALSEAIDDHRVRAVAVESVYDHPEEMAGLFVSRSGLGSLPLITRMTQTGFRWLNAQYRNVPPLKTRISIWHRPMTRCGPQARAKYSEPLRRHTNSWSCRMGTTRECSTTNNTTTKTAS